MIARIAQLVMTFVLVTFFTFLLSRAAPGDPYVSDAVAESAVINDWQRLHDSNNYLAWLSATARLDFGNSFFDQRPVRDRVLESVAPTALIATLALLLTFGIGVPLGMWLAVKPSRWSRLVDSGLFALHGIPVFWGGLVLGLAASAAGFATHGVIALPVIALVYPGLTRVARYQRAATLRALSSPAVQLARAKGLPESRVRSYILRAALNAPLGVVASEIPWLIGGSVVVERIFSIHGMGMLTFDAIMRRDVPVIMGVTAVMTFVAIAASLVTDLAQTINDPRLRS